MSILKTFGAIFVMFISFNASACPDPGCGGGNGIELQAERPSVEDMSLTR